MWADACRHPSPLFANAQSNSPTFPLSGTLLVAVAKHLPSKNPSIGKCFHFPALPACTIAPHGHWISNGPRETAGHEPSNLISDELPRALWSISIARVDPTPRCVSHMGHIHRNIHQQQRCFGCSRLHDRRCRSYCRGCDNGRQPFGWHPKATL